MPPPRGGITTWAELVLGSRAAREWDISVIDTSPGGDENQEARFDASRVVPGLRMIGASLLRRADVAHLNTNFGFALYRTCVIAVALRMRGIRTIVHLHGGDFETHFRRRPKAIQLVLARTFRHSTLVAMTRATERFLREDLAHPRVVYLPNFTDLEQFHPSDRISGQSPLRILFVGWVMRGKGIFELLDALCELPEARLDVVGPYVPAAGEHPKPLVEERLRDPRLAGRVVIHGPKPHSILPEYFRNADVFALPSHREGFPLTLIEAMAAALPVVVSRVGAMGDIVDEARCGVVVPPHNARALTDALQDLSGDPERRRELGASGRAHARAHLSVEAVIPKLDSLWRGDLPSRGT
jgi:glycosyltransferase involved in cell wall biosynthesis